MNIIPPNTTLDPCSQWIMENQATTFMGENTTDKELEWLRICIGPQRLNETLLYPLTVIYVTMGITGTLGNVMVCTVIARNLSMRTSTNFFLFSLAVADIAILIMGASFDLSVYWQQYPWVLGDTVCKLRAFLAEMTSYCSVLTILAFSCERYLAICHPMYSYTMAGLKRTYKIIFFLSIISAVAAAPFAVYTRVNYWRDPYDGQDVASSAFCGMLDIPFMLYELSSFVFFLIPLVMFLYMRMGIRIRITSAQNLGQSRQGDEKRQRNKKAVLQMLAVVVFSFFLCWAPFHAQRLLYVMHVKHRWNLISDELFYSVNEKMFYITGIFLYLSSTINPIVYNLMSAKYRKAFKDTLLRPCVQNDRPLDYPSMRSTSSMVSRTTAMQTKMSRESSV